MICPASSIVISAPEGKKGIGCQSWLESPSLWSGFRVYLGAGLSNVPRALDPGVCSPWSMGWVPKLKYEVLLPGYLVIRTMGGAGASSSKQQASSKLTPPDPKLKENQSSPSGFGSPPKGSWDHEQSSLGPGMPVSRPRWASARPNGRAWGGPKVGPKRAQNGPKSPKTGPGGSETGARGARLPCSRAESTWVLCGLPLCRVLTDFCPKMVSVGQFGPGPSPDPKLPKITENGARHL